MTSSLFLGIQGCSWSQEGKQTLNGELQSVAQAFRIEINAAPASFKIKTFYGPIVGKDAEPPEINAYAILFKEEFSLYPIELIQKTKLKKIVLCSELAYDGQRRNAIPDFEHDVLYLDVSRGSDDKTYLRKVIHHEFFHIVDYRDDGKLYEDDLWKRLNPSYFRYGNGGKEAQELSSTSILTTKYPGFLNHYSTTGVEEDKAEMFANLIVEIAYVEKRAKTESVILAKVERMKELLIQFSPAMDDRFWSKVRDLKRSTR